MTELESQLAELRSTNPLQYSYVYWRSILPTTTAALAKIDRSPNWLYTQENKLELQELADALMTDRVTQAGLMLREATLKAVGVMVDDLDSKDRKLRQAAAKDILDRVGLRAPDKTQVEVMASVAVRALDDVLAQVYGRPALTEGDIVEGEVIADNMDKE